MTKQELKSLILKDLRDKGKVTAANIVKAADFSRVYVNRILQELRESGAIVLVGRTDQAHYVPADKTAYGKAKRGVQKFVRQFTNKGLNEEAVLDEVRRETGIFLGLPKNVYDILTYSFSEMLNNAIDHSGSRKIRVSLKREHAVLRFDVVDRGVGIFRHIMKKRKLSSTLEAIQDLTKGKLTTAPREHSGEGIFFTSKVADTLTIQSSTKKLIFNNIIGDIFVNEVKDTGGTKITFIVGLKTIRVLSRIFKKYTEGSFEFSKTKVAIKLFKMGAEYISRSQARRVTVGLDKFKIIVLDFKDVKTVGQGFADEVFRVWQNRHPKIMIEYINANENIEFMIKRAHRL